MKKLSLLLFVMLIGCVCMTGCGKKTQSDKEGINVVTTKFASYDFARAVVGDKGNVTMLLPPASESHTYEPTPQDIISIQNADLFVYNGGESETWVDEVLKDIDTSKVKVISCMDMVTLYEEETVEGMQAEEEEEEGEEGEEVEYDEHVWTSPMNAKKIVEGIEKEVAEIDAANKDTYLENAASYEQKLDKLDSEFKEVVSKANNPTVVFGDRFPLRYFVEEYGIKYFAAFPGCAEDTEPNASTVAFLIDKVKAEKIPVVFHIELSNEKITNTICESTGAKSMLFHACHNISKDDFEAGVTYVDLMEQNVKNLDAAFNE